MVLEQVGPPCTPFVWPDRISADIEIYFSTAVWVTNIFPKLEGGKFPTVQMAGKSREIFIESETNQLRNIIQPGSNKEDLFDI